MGTLASPSIVSWFMISPPRLLCRRLPRPWAPSERLLKVVRFLRRADKVWTEEFLKRRNAAPGSIRGCSGSHAYIGSAELNIVWLHSTEHMTVSVAEPGYAQHSGYWRIYAIFTKTPTGFLPLDCELSLWGAKENRYRIDQHPQPHPPTHRMILTSLVMCSHFHTVHMYTRRPDLHLISLHQRLVTVLRREFKCVWSACFFIKKKKNVSPNVNTIIAAKVLIAASKIAYYIFISMQ